MIEIRKVSENATSVLLGWDRIDAARGYKFTVDGKISHTWDGSRTTVRVDKNADRVLVEAMGVLDSGTWPAEPPPSGFTSPIGFISNKAPGYFPPTRLNMYGVVAAEGPAPAAVRGLKPAYRTTITAQGYTNISEQEVISKGWALIGQDGQIMRNRAYGNVALADAGIPAYQARWLEASAQYLRAHGNETWWGDDFTSRVSDFAGQWPAKYPTMTAYQEGALLPFARFMAQNAGAAGLKNGTYNSFVSLDDNASLTKSWWAKVGPFSGALCEEYWQQMFWVPKVRFANEFWGEHRALHQQCNQLKVGFQPVCYESASPGGLQYIMGTFLLDWDPAIKASALLWSNPDASTTTDQWNPVYEKVAALGIPTGPPTSSGNVHTRLFQQGTVRVDAGNGTASIL